MIMIILLMLITIFVVAIGLGILSIGGTIFTVLFADVIVAAFIIWFIFFRTKRRK